MTDYASELLGGAQAPLRTADTIGGAQMPPAQRTDYASELLGGKTYTKSVMMPVEENAKGASFGALVKSSMADDPQTKMRIFAKSRFPKLEESDALSRYGIIDGDIVYLDADGKIKKESPSGVTGFVKEMGAGLIGQAPAVIGGTAGAIMGAPAGPAAAAGGAALGAAGGKGFSQVISNLLYDEPQTPGGNAAGMATEAAVSGGTTYLGSKIAQKIGERAVARDIAKLDRPKADALIQQGKNIGVDLNVAQATNLPSLKGRYEVLGRLEPSMDIIDENRLLQGNQAANASRTFMDMFTPRPVSGQTAGEGARAGAKSALDSMAENRAIASKPWYDKALAASVDTKDETLSKLADTPAFKSAFERGQRIAANEGVDIGAASNTMKALHYTKLGLDDLIATAPREGIGSTESRAIVGVKNQLLKFMDSQSKDYARARSIYGHYMPTLSAKREGLLGAIADLPDTAVNDAAKKVFNPTNSPEEIRSLRSTFFRYDQGEKWNGMLKSYLQDTFEKAGQEFKSGAGGIRGQAPAWRAMLMGNLKQAVNLKAAMTDPQFNAMKDMMDVFEAMGRVTGAGGSPTMPLQEAAKQLRDDAGRGVIGNITRIAEPQNWARDIGQWLNEARMGRHAEEMARVMTSPDGINKLKQLKQLSIMDKRLVSGFSSLFGVGNQGNQSAEDMPIRQPMSKQP